MSGLFFRLLNSNLYVENFSIWLKNFSYFLFRKEKKCVIGLNGIFIKVIDFYKELFFFFNNWNEKRQNFFLTKLLKNCY